MAAGWLFLCATFQRNVSATSSLGAGPIALSVETASQFPGKTPDGISLITHSVIAPGQEPLVFLAGSSQRREYRDG